ncbi:MAG: PhnE/PtxC family ABC transporter permease, partial [Acidimicrobiia bacterium]
MSTLARPEAPRRAITLVPSLVLATTLFALGGLTANWLRGVIWGGLAGLGLVAALRMAGARLPRPDEGLLIGTSVAAAVISTVVLPDLPEEITPALTLRFAAGWAVLGGGVAAALRRRGLAPAGLIAIVLGWAVAGALALPTAQTFEVLTPLEAVIGEAPGLGVATYALAGLTTGLIGTAVTLAAATRLSGLFVGAGLLFLTTFAGAQVGFTIPGLIRNIGNVVNIPNFWPPDFDWAIGTGQWFWLPSWDFGSATQASPLVETFRIAIIASIIGTGVALPVAFLASKLTTPNQPIYLVDKGFMNVILTIPDLFWAMLFTLAVGFNAFAGALALIMFSLAIMAKLLSETVDAVDPGPLEAARATGASHFPAIRTSVLPQVLP